MTFAKRWNGSCERWNGIDVSGFLPRAPGDAEKSPCDDGMIRFARGRKLYAPPDVVGVSETSVGGSSEIILACDAGHT